MKSFKEFLMEADNQDQDQEQNNNDQGFEMINIYFKKYLDNINENNSKDIDQKTIVKYLVCRNLQAKNFTLKNKDINKILGELETQCKNFFNINSKYKAKFKAINTYISEKYDKKIDYFYLNITDGNIKKALEVDSEFTDLNDFLENMEKIIKKRLEEAEKNSEPQPQPETEKKENLEQAEAEPEPETEPETEKKENLEQADSSHANGTNSGTNSGNNENYGTTRQGSYLGRFTSAQMEDIMSGNEDKIANALGVMAKAAKDRCDELLRQVKEKVEKNSKYLKEEEVAQKVLWEGIFNRLPKQEKLKIQKQHGTKSVYKDEDNQKLTEIINNYKGQIDKLVDTTVSNCLPLGEKLHAFNTSAKMESKLKEQLRMNVRNFTNKLYDITLEVEKASRKSGFFENKKIEKGSKKEEEWNNFKNSEKGENFDKQLNEKTIVLKKELSKILPNVQKVSSEADMNVKLVSKLIKESSDAKDFLKKASLKKVYENGKTIFILDWLYKKGIPVPLRTAISGKYSKNLDIVSWNELFKDKEFLNSLNGYGKDWENFKIARGNLRTLEDFKKFREQYGKDFEVEINILCKDFIEQEKRQQNGGTGEEDSQEQKTKTPAELAAEYIRKNGGGFPSVTSNSCDGLPIGARKYSKAVRRRMNYALNKYL